MENQDKLSRRHFVQLSLLGAGSICLLSGCARKTANWRFFTDAEALAMDAIAEQIIPTDEWPGGRDAGVTNFIDKQLTGPYTRFQDAYRRGIAALQESCRMKFGKEFENIGWEQQTSLLESLEAGKMNEAQWNKGFDQEFFNMVRDHSMQAYYGNPRHGGNKNNISYKMLKIDAPLIIGQNRYNV